MSVKIVAVGMVTALGLDWETSCAASRAGILRASVLDHFPFQTEQIGEPQFARGHQVDLLAKGFEGYGRLLRLLAGAMREIHARCDKHPETLRGAAVYLSLPDPTRSQPQFESATFDENELHLSLDDWALRLTTQASRLAGWPEPSRLEGLSVAGHAGFAQVLQRAIADLESGKVDSCIVGGVDSLLDEDTLTWLLNTDRLKHPAHAAGLMPGEGAALFLLSSSAKALPEICSLEAVNVGEESQTFMDDKAANGSGLWRTVRTLTSLTSQGNSSKPIRVWLTSDHNGEVYRARELGGFLVRCRGEIQIENDLPVVLPALSFGDTAAASGAIGMAVSSRALSRRYLPPIHNIVLSTSDGPLRGAILLRGVNHGG